MSEWFAAVDPGVKYFAWVAFYEGRLTDCGLNQREDALSILGDFPFGIVEKPRASKDDKSTRADIQELCIALGEYGRCFRERRYEVASSCPKDIRHAQALKRLSPEELAILPKQITKRKHILCALWIALKHAGRLTAAPV
jgi:hypothetical protein